MGVGAHWPTSAALLEDLSRTSRGPSRTSTTSSELLPSQATRGALHVLVELAQDAPVGGHGEPDGIRDPFSYDTIRVLRQSMDASRRLTPEPPERGGVLGGHGEYQLGLFDHLLAHLPGAMGPGIDARLLERR